MNIQYTDQVPLALGMLYKSLIISNKQNKFKFTYIRKRRSIVICGNR